MMETKTRAPADTGSAREKGHGQAPERDYSSLPQRRDLDALASDSYPAPEQRDPAAEREALLERIAQDGGQRAAFALLALHGNAPGLAEPILDYIGNRYDLIDELLLCIGDSAVHDAQRREAE